MCFAEQRAERPLASPRPRRRFRGAASAAVAVFHLKKEDYLDQARQDPQGHPRCQVGRKPLLQQSRRGVQVVVSIPVWVLQHAIWKRYEQFNEKHVVVHVPCVGLGGRTCLLVNTKCKHMPYESRNEQLAIFYEVPKPRSGNHQLGRAAESVELVCVEQHGRHTGPRVQRNQVHIRLLVRRGCLP